MRYLIILSLLLSLGFCSERPKVALVLSGGGARGGVHVGVLKILEQNKIPVDMIVGTSMGSFVGGLYASGKTPYEIENILVDTDWHEYIRTDYNRRDIPMKRKQIEHYFQGRLGIGIDAKDNFVLPTGVFKRQSLLLKFLKESDGAEYINNFDDLSIPFRAIATNIKNGKPVILKSGSLGRAMYASSAIPGAFQPLKIDGMYLVDGGVSKNLPISIAKDMGADIVIAVDASEGFDKNLDVNSYLVIMNQLVNILMRKNADDDISLLTSDDVLITPSLEGITGLDVEKYPEIIKLGEKFAIEKLPEYEHLAISEDDYITYLQNHRYEKEYKKAYIDEIIIKNDTYISDDAIRDRLYVKVGDTLDECVLRKNMLHIYNMMLFDSVEYELKTENSKNIVIIKTTPSSDNHGEIRFALGFEDDFSGGSSYSFKMGYRVYGINSYGGEINSDFEIGRKEQLRSEFYQPLDSLSRYYIRPNILYVNQIDKEDKDLDVERYGASLSIGRHFFSDHELEFGVGLYKDVVESLKLQKSIKNFKSRPLYISFKSDNLDNLNFPNIGFKSEIKWLKESKDLAGEYDYEQLSLDMEKPISMDSHNITLYLKAAATFNAFSEVSLINKYTLGGLFNLSGYIPYSFNDDNIILGVVKYRYELKNGGFFGTLNAPLYAGVSLEVGNTWSDYESYDRSDLKKSASVYVAADTFLGPLYLAYGASTDGHMSSYLYLGEKF